MAERGSNNCAAGAARIELSYSLPNEVLLTTRARGTKLLLLKEVSLRGLKSIYFVLLCAMLIAFRDSLLFGERRKDKETRAIFPQPLFISRWAKKMQGTEDAFESQEFEISSDAKFVWFDFSDFQVNQGG